MDGEALKKALPVAVHGDEGQGKKERSVMLISWSVLGMRNKSVLMQKFPFCAIRSINMAYGANGRNLTLLKLQEELVKSLSLASKPDECRGRLNGYSLQYVAGRGDWKFKTAWLCELRDYTNLKEKDTSAGFCRRCLCTSNCRDRHWLDVKVRSWNDPAAVAQILHDNIAADLPCLGSSWVRFVCFMCVPYFWALP